MRSRVHDEAGDTLIEIILALVIMGVVVGALLATIATTASASKSHRDFVTADAVLRDYAETAKQAVRDTCTTANAGTGAFSVAYIPPSGSGITVASTMNGSSTLTCPSLTTVNPVLITATLPSGTTKALTIDVRTP